MWRSRLHLYANLFLGFITAALFVIATWSLADAAWVRAAVIVIALLIFSFTAHKLAPRLTGTLVEKLCDALRLNS